MGKLLISGLAVCLLTAGVQATVLFSEDWETGTDGWVQYGAVIYPTLSDAQNTTPGGTYSLKTQATTNNYMNAMDTNMPSVTPTNWFVEWSFFDTGATREYLQIRNFANGGSSGTLQQLISFGVYNAAPAVATHYNVRVANGGAGWTNTTIPRVANVWHTMRVEQDEAGNLKFLVDGTVGLETTTTSIFGVSSLRVGSGLGNGSKSAYYDDIKVGIVPEPATLALLLGGLPFLRRRRS
jgi:hypothetical protein